MSEHCTLDDIRAVLAPGTACSYVELLDRLRAAGRPTSGTGVVLKPFNEEEWHEGFGDRDGEFIAWHRDRWWDEEDIGGWTTGEMWIARRPEAAS